MKPWEVIHRESVIENPWVRVYKDTVRTGSGVLIQGYYTIHQFSVAMVLPITAEGSVVLVREYRHGCQDYVWQVPAGKINDGETAAEAARRELLEETGYKVLSLTLLGSWYISSIRMPDKQFVFIAQVENSGEANRDATEEIIIKEVPFDEAMQMVLNNEIKDPHSCTAILWAERMRRDGKQERSK